MTDSTQRQIGRAAAVMMASVFLSRLLGYARDAVIAYQNGATAETDAYFAAFTIPDFLNYLLAGGSLSITFIPIFAKHIADGTEEQGHRAFSTIATIMGTAMVFFVILCEFLADRIVPFIAPGFPPAQVAAAATLTRIVLPAQLFFYLGGLLMAVQYARNRFLLPAFAPLIYNASIILGGLLLGGRLGMSGFAWGVLAGSFLGNFALQAYGAHRAGLRFAPRIDFGDRDFREFVRLSIPIMIGFSLVVVDEWVTRIFGSFLLAGAITWLNNARRLGQVPIGILGQATGVASFPFLSALAARGEREKMWDALSTTLRWVFLVSCAAGAAAFVLSREVALLVYKRGAFTVEDARLTASALATFSLGIPFWCAQNIVSRGFFAMRDTWTPTLVGTGALLAALPFYFLLRQRMGVAGLALASSIGIFIHAASLYGILMARTVGRSRLGEIAEYARMAAAAILAGLGGSYALGLASRVLSWESYYGAGIRVAAGGAAVTLACYAAALLLRSRTARSIHGRRDILHPPGRTAGDAAPPGE